MNIRSITRMSIYNLIAKKKQNIFIISMLIILEVIMFSVLLFQNILLENIYSISNDRLSQCFVVCTGDMLTENSISLQEFLDKLEGQEDVDDICVYDYDYFGDTYDANFKNIILQIDNKQYVRNAKYKMDDYNTIYLQVVKYDYNYSFFSQVECEEFKEKYDGEMYYCGGDFIKEGQVILGENLLRKYNIPQEEWENLIGKKIDVLYQEENSEDENNKTNRRKKMYEQLEICGIVKQEALLVNAKAVIDSYMYISCDREAMMEDSVSVRFYAEKYSGLKNLKQLIEEVTGIVPVLPDAANVYEYIQQIYDQVSEYGSVIFKMSIAVELSFFILILLFEFRHRKKYYSMIRVLGGTNHTIRSLVLLENILPALVAFLIAAVGNEILKRKILEGIQQSEILQILKGNVNYLKCTMLSEALLLAVAVFTVLGISIAFCRKYTYTGLEEK